MIDRRQKVLAQLEGGSRTWDELRALTKVSDEGLGFAIGELLDLRKIWTGQRGDERVYGIERRAGARRRMLVGRVWGRLENLGKKAAASRGMRVRRAATRLAGVNIGV